jgi:hypothetical protein
MAVQMAAQRGRNLKRALSAPEESIESKFSVLPDKKERIFDVELGVLMLNGSVDFVTDHLPSFALLASLLPSFYLLPTFLIFHFSFAISFAAHLPSRSLLHHPTA